MAMSAKQRQSIKEKQSPARSYVDAADTPTESEVEREPEPMPTLTQNVETIQKENPTPTVSSRRFTRLSERASAAQGNNGKRLQLVCTEQERQMMHAAAKMADYSFNQWALMILLDAAQKQLDANEHKE